MIRPFSTLKTSDAAQALVALAHGHLPRSTSRTGPRRAGPLLWKCGSSARALLLRMRSICSACVISVTEFGIVAVEPDSRHNLRIQSASPSLLVWRM